MCKKKILARLKRKNICINVFGYKKGLIFPIYVSDQKFENSMDLLLSIDDKSHYVHIKDFNSFMFHKTKNKNKKYFCKSCLQCFRNKNVLPKHKEDCLSIHDIQSVNVEKEQLSLKNISSKYQLHLKFMLILSVITFLVVLLPKLFILMISLASQLLFLG